MSAKRAFRSPDFFAANVETSPHFSEKDPQDERADELKEMGDHIAAGRVRDCGSDGGGKWSTTKRCGRRDCPTCSREAAKRYARRVRAAIRQMTKPIVALVTLRSWGAKDLAATMRNLRKMLVSRLRRQKCMKAVRAAVGAIEPHLSERGCWNVHAHLALEVVGRFEVSPVASAWKKMTGGRGTFGIHRDPKLRSPTAFAAYITKPADWCPPPGQLDLKELAIVLAAMKGRHVVVRWGIAHESPSQPRRPDGAS